MKEYIKNDKRPNYILDDAIMTMLLQVFNYEEIKEYSKIKLYIKGIRKEIWALEIGMNCEKLLKNE